MKDAWESVERYGAFLYAENARGPRRTLDYAHPRLVRLFDDCDAILHEVGRLQRRRQACSSGHLISLLDDGSGGAAERTERVVSALKQARFLVEQGPDVRLGWWGARLGLTAALLRVGATVLGIVKGRDWAVAPAGPIQKQWQRTFRPGGVKSPGEADEAETEAKGMLRRAKYENLLLGGRVGDDPHWGWRLNPEHRLAEVVVGQARSAAKIVDALEGKGGTPSVDDAIRASELPTPRARLWLEALASEGALKLVSGRVSIQRRSRFAAWLLDGHGGGI